MIRNFRISEAMKLLTPGQTATLTHRSKSINSVSGDHRHPIQPNPMVRVTERPRRFVSGFLYALALIVSLRAAAQSTRLAPAAILPAAAPARHSPWLSPFSQPSLPLPRYTQIDAPLLGNGDLAVAIGGPPEAQEFWIGKNDFWELRDVWKLSGPRPIGHLDILIPGLEGASYYAEQNLRDATTSTTLQKGTTRVTLRSWVAATENLLIVELTARSQPPSQTKFAEPPLEGTIRLWIPSRPRTIPMSDHRPPPGVASDWIGMPPAPVTESPAGVFSGSRGFLQNVTVPVAAACAFRLFDSSRAALTSTPPSSALSSPSDAAAPATAHFRLAVGHPLYLVAAIRSLNQSPRFLAEAQDRVAAFTPAALAPLFAAHQRWWRDFWGKSSIDLGDPELEWRYHVSNYIVASCSRDPDYPPGIAGPWVTTDQPMWTGAYTYNYNHEAVFYGLYSSNHLEQADPEDAPALAFRERAEYYAQSVFHCRGAIFPVKFGPVGVETTGDREHPNSGTKPHDPPWIRQNGGLFLGQRSDAAYALTNMAQRWYVTHDLAYARRVYPLVRDVALFWEDYLRLEPTPPDLVRATQNLPTGLRQPAPDRYVDYNDGLHEGGQEMNPIVSLALIRQDLNLALELSQQLQLDSAEHAPWRRILANLSAFVTQERDHKTVFRLSERGIAWSNGNTLAIQEIYPANAFGLGSDPRLLSIARNTLEATNRWIDVNGSTAFFPAAVWVGIDPALVLSKLHELRFDQNGIVYNFMHMLENSSIVPNTVDEMLLQSHEGILRLFPVWPPHHDASFQTLRAYGAFLVSAAIKNDVIQDVTIQSEAGQPCTLQNPWPAAAVRMIRNGHPAERLTGATLVFPTASGEQIEMAPSSFVH